MRPRLRFARLPYNFCDAHYVSGAYHGCYAPRSPSRGVPKRRARYAGTLTTT
jgi:hypothetical protein